MPIFRILMIQGEIMPAMALLFGFPGWLFWYFLCKFSILYLMADITVYWYIMLPDIFFIDRYWISTNKKRIEG